MNLIFSNPLLLFGLAAGVLPILIHRLIPRQAVLREFSAVRLLLQSQRDSASPHRLKNLLLLALRILAVLTLVLLMARPVLTGRGLLAFGSGGAKVLLIDNSLSMGFQEEKGERVDLARKVARRIIENLTGKVLILPTVPATEEKPEWLEPKEALQEMRRIPLSFGRGDPASALRLAYRYLAGIPAPHEILILSDLARGDWEGFHLKKLGRISADPAVTVLRMGGAARDPNLAIEAVRLSEGEPVVGVPARLEARVANLSDQPVTTMVQFHLAGEKTDQKSITLKAREEKEFPFALFFQKPGWIEGEVTLSGDRLEYDDHFYFTLKVREKVKVLIIDGDPKRSLKASESYYLVNALHPRSSTASPFLAKVILETELASLDLSPYAALFLLNVAEPPIASLVSFAESGRPILIFLGDRVKPESYNRIPLLPWRLEENKESGAPSPQKIAWIDYSREAWKAFPQGGEKSLKRARFHRYFKIQGSSKNLLLLDNQDPLLVEARWGKGPLFFFASSADLDWNDFPLESAYLPFLQGLLKEAVGLTRHSLPARFPFGDPFPEKARALQILGPPGGPGIYQFSSPAGEVRRMITIPASESDLAKVTDQELQKKFAPIAVRVVEYKDGDPALIQPGRKELWPFLLLGLFIVLAVEMGVANKA